MSSKVKCICISLPLPYLKMLRDFETKQKNVINYIALSFNDYS